VTLRRDLRITGVIADSPKKESKKETVYEKKGKGNGDLG